jgi:lipoyl(octanoyl) transferase
VKAPLLIDPLCGRLCVRLSRTAGWGERGTAPQPRSNARPLQYGEDALRFSKGKGRKAAAPQKNMMSETVAAFAGSLRANASALGDTDGVEWRTSASAEPYEEVVAAMEERAAAIFAGEASELVWLLEHPPLYTAGPSAKASDLLDPARFPVHRTGRGGQYTYHGPGQLVAYVLFDLNARGRDVRLHVERLEGWVIAALGDYGIRAGRREGRPGVWVRAGGRDEKIAALGVRVRRWVTYHGVAVNVCPDLAHFGGIVPCGIEDAGVTSIAKMLGAGADGTSRK